MILRDPQGDVDVGIGDYFTVATGDKTLVYGRLSVICPDDIHRPGSPIWCRVVEGAVLFDGDTFQPGSLLPFTPAVVACGVRDFRRSYGSQTPPRPKRETGGKVTPRPAPSLF